MTILNSLTAYSGRMSRPDFWLKGLLPLLIASFLPMAALLVLLYYGALSENNALFSFVNFLMYMLLWFQLPLYVKRLHDRNRSAWFLLISLVPIIGGIWLFLEVGLRNGTIGENRFGNDPLKCEESMQFQGLSKIPTWNLKAFVLLLVSQLLAVCLIIIFVAVVPVCKKDFLDLERTLPGFTIITLNAAVAFENCGSSIKGLFFGFWIWMGLRAYNVISCGNASKWNYRWLWSSVLAGAILNVLIGCSLSLPFVRLRMEKNAKSQQEVR